MIDWLTELILAESKWIASAIALALAVVAVRFRPRQRSGLSQRVLVLWAMNRFYAGMIAILAFGHLLAVTLKLFQGTLDGSRLYFYGIGIALALPSWWLTVRLSAYILDEQRHRRAMLALNGFLILSLLVVGPQNWPLALPAVLNIAYQLHTRRAVGWTIVAVSVAGNLLLFIGAIKFFLSGQSFEDFGQG